MAFLYTAGTIVKVCANLTRWFGEDMVGERRGGGGG